MPAATTEPLALLVIKPVWHRKRRNQPRALPREANFRLQNCVYYEAAFGKKNLGFSHVFSANLSYILSNILYRKFPICIYEK